MRGLAAAMIVVHHAASTADTTSLPLITVPAAVMDGAVVVFFVLSGYLIYRPMVVAHVDGAARPSMARYALRRAVRILPAYWLALSVLWALGEVELGTEWWRYYLLVQSWSPITAFGGIVQAWTLSVEVGFYVLAPIWAAAVVRVGRSLSPLRAHLVGCGVLIVAGIAFRQAVSLADPSWRGLSFQWLPSYLDAFGVGMAIAVVQLHLIRSPRSPLTPIARHLTPGRCFVVAAVAFSWYAWRIGPPDLAMLADPNGAYQGWYWQRRQLTFGAVGVLLAAPLVLVVRPASAAVRAMASRPAVWLGTISFGLYLWHFAAIRAVDRELVAGGAHTLAGHVIAPGTAAALLVLLAAGFALGGVAALLSWRLVERPLLQSRWVRGRSPRASESPHIPLTENAQVGPVGWLHERRTTAGPGRR